MKQVVKFLSCFLSKTLFLIILTLNIARAYNDNSIAVIDNAMINEVSEESLYTQAVLKVPNNSDAKSGMQSESNGQNNYDPLTALDITAALKNILNLSTLAYNSNISEQNQLTTEQRKGLIERSTKNAKDQIQILHDMMLQIAAAHKQQVESSGKKALAPNIKTVLQGVLFQTTQHPNIILTSHSIHYILRSLTATDNSGSPYNGFMVGSYCVVSQNKLLSEIFPNKEKVTHLEIIQKLEELEQKAMHGSITVKEKEYVVGLSQGLSGQLFKFLEMFAHRLTIEEGYLNESKQIAGGHLDEINWKLSQNAAEQEYLEKDDYHYEITAEEIFQHENDIVRNNNVARNNAKIANSLSENS